MRLALRSVAVLAVLAVVGYFLIGRGNLASIQDDSFTTPAQPGSIYGHCITPRGTYSPGRSSGPLLVESELGTRGPAGEFLPRPGAAKQKGPAEVLPNGLRVWGAGGYLGLLAGNYVVKTTLLEEGDDGSSRPLAVCYSKPLVLP